MCADSFDFVMANTSVACHSSHGKWVGSLSEVTLLSEFRPLTLALILLPHSLVAKKSAWTKFRLELLVILHHTLQSDVVLNGRSYTGIDIEASGI